MCSYKILKYIGCLALINPLISVVKATTLSTCTENYNSANCNGSGEDSYCIKDNIIFAYNSESPDSCIKATTLSTEINVVKVTDGSVVDLSSGTITTADIQQYAIYDCNASTCTQTYGYVKDNSGAYYSINKSGTNAAVSNASTESCSNANGQLRTVSDSVVLCLSSEAQGSLASKSYFMLNYSGNIFTANSNNDNATKYIHIKAGTNYFVYNGSIADGYYFSKNNEVITGAATEGGKLFKCTGGLCLEETTIADGYYVNTLAGGFGFIQCIENVCKLLADDTTASCSGSKIGQIIQNGALCLSADKSATVSNAGSSYVVSYHADSTFVKQVVEDGLFGVVKVTANSMTFDSSVNAAIKVDGDLKVDSSGSNTYAHCNNGVCYNDCNASTKANCLQDKYYIFSDEEGTTIQARASTKSYLFFCDSSACTAKTDVIGYFKNGYYGHRSTMPYIQCSADASGAVECQGIANPTTTCSADKVGTLVADGNLCLGMDSASPIVATFSDTAASYLLAYASGSIFTTITANQYGVVKIDAGSMSIDTTAANEYGVCTTDVTKVVDTSTLNSSTTTCATGTKTCDFLANGICYNKCIPTDGTNCSANTYYLVKDTTYIPIFDTTAGLLYYCATAGEECVAKTAVKGYYVNNKDDTFVCSSGTTCQREAAASACDASNIGKLVLDSSDTTTGVSFCLDFKSDTAIKKPLSTDGNYLLAYVSGNIFSIGSDKFGAVAIKDKSVTLMAETGNALESSTSPRTLAASGVTGTLYTCTAGICSAVMDVDIKTGYYKNIGDPQYIKCVVSTSDANPPVTSVTCTAIAVTAASDCTGTTIKSGDIIEVTSGTTYKICLTKTIPLELASGGSNDGAYFVDVSGDGNIFGHQNNGLAIIDISGTNVNLHTQVDGYVLTDTSNKLITANNGIGSLASCTSGICSLIPVANIKTGYYRNSGVTELTEAVYITCIDDTTTTKKCTAKIVDSTTKANGDIITDNATTPQKFTICLDSSVEVELKTDGTNDGQYFLEVSTNTSNIFGKITSGTYYVTVDIDHGSVTLHSKETGINRYRYATSSSYKLITDYSTVCTAGTPSTFSGSSTTVEFSLKEEVVAEGTEDPINYYQKVATTP